MPFDCEENLSEFPRSLLSRPVALQFAEHLHPARRLRTRLDDPLERPVDRFDAVQHVGQLMDGRLVRAGLHVHRREHGPGDYEPSLTPVDEQRIREIAEALRRPRDEPRS